MDTPAPRSSAQWVVMVSSNESGPRRKRSCSVRGRICERKEREKEAKKGIFLCMKETEEWHKNARKRAKEWRKWRRKKKTQEEKRTLEEENKDWNIFPSFISQVFWLYSSPFPSFSPKLYIHQDHINLKEGVWHQLRESNKFQKKKNTEEEEAGKKKLKQGEQELVLPKPSPPWHCGSPSASFPREQ